jgi:hypothetical protein
MQRILILPLFGAISTLQKCDQQKTNWLNIGLREYRTGNKPFNISFVHFCIINVT